MVNRQAAALFLGAGLRRFCSPRLLINSEQQTAADSEEQQQVTPYWTVPLPTAGEPTVTKVTAHVLLSRKLDFPSP